MANKIGDVYGLGCGILLTPPGCELIHPRIRPDMPS
jgi:hypothetical protein